MLLYSSHYLHFRGKYCSFYSTTVISYFSFTFFLQSFSYFKYIFADNTFTEVSESFSRQSSEINKDKTAALEWISAKQMEVLTVSLSRKVSI